MEKRVFIELPKNLNKFEAFAFMIKNLTLFDNLNDKDSFLFEVVKREEEESTGVGHSVSISHGMIPNLEKTMITLALSREGIVFDDKYPPVHLLFLIASNKDDNSEYIKVLSSLLSWLRDDEIRDSLLNITESKKKEAFLEMLELQEFRRFDNNTINNE